MAGWLSVSMGVEGKPGLDSLAIKMLAGAGLAINRGGGDAIFLGANLRGPPVDRTALGVPDAAVTTASKCGLSLSTNWTFEPVTAKFRFLNSLFNSLTERESCFLVFGKHQMANYSLQFRQSFSLQLKTVCNIDVRTPNNNGKIDV